MEAARAGNLGCVKLLANAGASLDVKDVSFICCIDLGMMLRINTEMFI